MAWLLAVALSALPGVVCGADVPPADPGKPIDLDVSGIHSLLCVPADNHPGSPMPLIIFFQSLHAFSNDFELDAEPLLSAVHGKGYLILAMIGEQANAYVAQHGLDALGALEKNAIAKVATSCAVDPERIFLCDLSTDQDLAISSLRRPMPVRFCGFISILTCGGSILDYRDQRAIEGLPLLVFAPTSLTLHESVMKASAIMASSGSDLTCIDWPKSWRDLRGPSPYDQIGWWLRDAQSPSPRAQVERPISWQCSDPAGKPTQEVDQQKAANEYLVQQPAIARLGRDRPAMVFLFAHPPGQPARVDAALSEEDALFRYPQAAEVPLIASRHFDCIAIDFTETSAMQNRLFNAENAPRVVFLDRNRKVYAEIRGAGKMTDRSLAFEMRKMLRADESAAIDAAESRMKPILKDMRAMHARIYQLQDALSRLYAQQSPRTITSERVLELDQQVDQGVAAIADLQKRYDALCKNLVNAIQGRAAAR